MKEYVPSESKLSVFVMMYHFYRNQTYRRLMSLFFDCKRLERDAAGRENNLQLYPALQDAGKAILGKQFNDLHPGCRDIR